MLLSDTEAAPEGAEVAWVCHGCHARHAVAEECCPGEYVGRHDLGRPCEDCALPEIVDEE